MLGKKAEFFRALGDETRLKIVRRLMGGECCACRFASLTGKDQTTVSRHLKILTGAGILKSRKEGRNVLYSLKNREKTGKLTELAGG
jgi:ArsR family transcriptional regulator